MIDLSWVEEVKRELNRRLGEYPSSANRAGDLLGSIKESLGFIGEYLVIISTSNDPKEIARSLRIIRQQAVLVAGYESELRNLLVRFGRGCPSEQITSYLQQEVVDKL